MTQDHEKVGPALDAVIHDHNQLPRLVQEAIQDVERTDLLSPSLIAPLVQHVLAHLRREEIDLFPLAERIAENPRFSKTASLRREHLVLRELLSDIEAALARRDRAAARGNLLELAASLRLHCDQEDALYSKTLAAGPSAAALVKDKTDGT